MSFWQTAFWYDGSLCTKICMMGHPVQWLLWWVALYKDSYDRSPCTMMLWWVTLYKDCYDGPLCTMISMMGHPAHSDKWLSPNADLSLALFTDGVLYLWRYSTTEFTHQNRCILLFESSFSSTFLMQGRQLWAALVDEGVLLVDAADLLVFDLAVEKTEFLQKDF